MVEGSDPFDLLDKFLAKRAEQMERNPLFALEGAVILIGEAFSYDVAKKTLDPLAVYEL